MSKYIFTLVLLAFCISSCTETIHLSDYYDDSKPFYIQKGFEGERAEIAVNSEQWEKLIAVLESNNKGWGFSPASHMGTMHLWQDDFKLIILQKTGVVISFEDEAGKPRQYSKTVELGELDFLFE